MSTPGATIAFIPGWGADARTWEPLKRAISGLAGKPNFVDCELPLQAGGEVGHWQAEVAKLASNIPANSVVVAWSLGGMLAIKIAEQFPERVSKLVLLGCNPSFVEREHWPQAMSQAVFDDFRAGFQRTPHKALKRFLMLQAQGHGDRKRVMKALENNSAIDDSNHQQACGLLELLEQIDNSTSLFELKQPVTMIFGDGDALVPVSAAKAVREQAAARQAADLCVDVLPNCGHAMHISEPEAVAVHVFSNAARNLTVDSGGGQLYKKEKHKIAASFGRASAAYDRQAHLQRRVATKLCAWSSETKGRVLDLGCGTGYCLTELSKRSEVEALLGLDIAAPMLQQARLKVSGALQKSCWLNADLENLPVTSDSIDTLVSSLAIQWCDNLPAIFNEAHRVMSKDARFLLSSLGPETLFELNEAWQQAAPNYVHVNRFVDANAVMACASDAGFEVELFSVDYEIERYDRVIELMRGLKAIGAHNVNHGSNPGLTGRSALKSLEQAYEVFRDEDKLPATYQVYYWVFAKRR